MKIKVNKLTVRIKSDALNDLKKRHSITKEQIKDILCKMVDAAKIELIEVENDKN